MDYTPIQYMLLFGMAIFFSSIAIDRETWIPSFISAFLWLVCALFSFILAPTTIGVAIGWTMGILSFVFMGVFTWLLITQFLDRKNARFEMGPL